MVQSYKHLAIIIPSYNESKNLSILLPNIARYVPGASIVVVDDSRGLEQEKTARLIQSVHSPSITLLFRGEKSGRGGAVLAGLKKALENPKTSYFIEMDADLAHDPKEIPMLVAAAPPSGIVIGSRYMEQSSIRDWPMRRLIQSKVINFVLRYWLGLHISDFTNGFRLYTRDAASFIASRPLYEKGFIALSEVAYTLKRAGFPIKEVPITFTDRKYGSSNAGIAELLASLFGAIRIRFRG